mmetsp:Transcript_26116/g.62717  ORF Transcript_26116/g.62717 Transcript_26116/m.62717 type:complete len:89 (-) Transcript_26116:973-1239(-)
MWAAQEHTRALCPRNTIHHVVHERPAILYADADDDPPPTNAGLMGEDETRPPAYVAVNVLIFCIDVLMRRSEASGAELPRNFSEYAHQ